MKIRAATPMIRPMYMLALVLVAVTLTLGADKASAQLHADGAHFEIGGDRFPAADTPRNEDRDVLGDNGQDLLGQD